MSRRRGAARAARVWCLAVVLSAPCAISAQTLTVSGRVIHRAESDRPLSGQWVVLQVAARDTGGALDSVRTGSGGGFRLTYAHPDTAGLYVVSTVYQGVEYFSRGLQVRGSPRLDAGPLFVYDTTSVGPPMRLERRLLVLARAGTPGGGGTTVQEMIEVSNPGTRTRVAGDSTRPVWRLALPPGATAWTPREGDVLPEAFGVAADTLSVFAPIWPGWPLRTSYEYALGGRTLRIPLDQWTGELNLLVEDTAARLAGIRLESLGVHALDGRRYAAYRAGPVNAAEAEGGLELRVALSRGALRGEDLLPYLVAAVAVALAWGLWAALRRKAAVPAGNRPSGGRRGPPAGS